MQFCLFLNGPKVAQLTPLSNYPLAKLDLARIGNKVLHRSRCCNECLLPTPLHSGCLCLLPVAPICCCYCFLCLCSVTVAASASVLCCCGGHYFLYLIALLSAAVFCYICCNMHERTTIMYFDQAWPGTGTTHSTSPQLKLKLVSFLGCTFSKGCREKGGGEGEARLCGKLWGHQMIYTLISVHRTCREIRCGRLVAPSPPSTTPQIPSSPFA